MHTPPVAQSGSVQAHHAEKQHGSPAKSSHASPGILHVIVPLPSSR